MDSSRATMYAALLLVALASTVSAAPQFQEGGGFSRFPPPPRGVGRPPVYYDDDDDDQDSSENELTFFQRLVRPWRWMDPVFDYFRGSNDDDTDEEVYDEGNFPGRFPGQQVARLDERPSFGSAPSQRYVARPAPQQPQQTARSDSAAYQPAQLAADAMQEEQQRGAAAADSQA